MFEFRDLRQLQLGGMADNLALSSLFGAGMLSNPAISGNHYVGAAMAGAAVAMAGGGWLGQRLLNSLHMDTMEGGTLRINSSKPPQPTPDGVHLGYIVDTGEPLIIPLEEWMRHAMLVGQSGVGKTVLGTWLMTQQIARGGGMLWIDGKLDPDNVKMLWQMCQWAGRGDDLRIITPGDPDGSNTYNPILYGDADEVASRVISLIPAAENNPGADYYRQEASQSVATLVSAIQSIHHSYSFADMMVLLNNAAALEDLEARLTPGSDAQLQLALFLHKFKSPQKFGPNQGVETIDIKKLKDTLGGIAGRMFSFGTGMFGRVLNAYSPEVRLKEDLLANRIIYVALPTMGKAEAASNFGKMVLGDFRTAIAQIQALPKPQRPWPPTLGFFDEAGSYVTQAWARIFEQSRSAHLEMTPAFQTKANLEVLGEELRAMVSGNTLTKVFFKPGEPETAEWMADMIGEENAVEYSISATQGRGFSRDSHVSSKPGGANETGGTSFSETVKLGHKITPTELAKLGKGEAIVTYDGQNVYHIRIPMVTFDPQFDPLPNQINRQRTRFAKGLNLYQRINDLTRSAGPAGSSGGRSGGGRSPNGGN